MAQGNLHHEITLSAEPILKVGGFSVTNSWLNSVIAVFILIFVFLAVGKKIALIPKGIQNVFEVLLETALNFADSITGSRKASEKVMPFVLSLFLFILVNNWLGILPGIGTIGFVEKAEDGRELFIPFFRGGTADLNTTLALALLAVIFTHFVGVFTVGFWKHLNKFINIQGILNIFRNFSKDKTLAFINPIKFLVGIIEVLSEGAKVASLSLRLFGNIFAGEVLLASMMMIFAFVLPVPFIFLEILVGAVQAMIFSVLVLVFITMSMKAEEH